jgi:hypothetical protein
LHDTPICQRNLQPQVQVLHAHYSPRFVKAAHFKEYLPSDKRSAGRDMCLPVPEIAKVDVVETIGVDHARIRDRVPQLYFCLTRVPAIVVIEQANPLAGGGLNSGISCGSLAPVGLTDHACSGKACGYLGGTIGGPVVDNDNLGNFVSLRENALDGLGEEQLRIVSGNYRANRSVAPDNSHLLTSRRAINTRLSASTNGCAGLLKDVPFRGNAPKLPFAVHLLPA